MQIEKFGNDLGLFEEPFATLCVGTSFITLGRGGGPREKSCQNSVGQECSNFHVHARNYLFN